MVFSSSVFLFHFLPVVFLFACIAKNKYRNHVLILGSLVFYAWGEPIYVLLMIVSILLNWFFGKRVKGHKAWLAVAVTVNLLILGYYKYAGFMISTVNSMFGTAIPVRSIPLPIGISFFTFQAMSYVIDVYRGDTDNGSLTDVALYISFFPQLIAGPIVKYREIIGQIREREITWKKVADGFRMFIYGLGKKVLIANVIGLCADTVFGYENPGCLAAWIGAIAYTFQIYYDFSGYSDMAIGLGKMFGFTYPVNFDHPYLSASITEFWRRWHISLGTWFKEYVYIPLGGNRKGTARTYLNLVIVFFLTGLWHGADLSFILWGLYHGLFSILERIGLGKVLKKHRGIGTVYCFMIVLFGWVLFRAADTGSAIRYIQEMFNGGTGVQLYEYLTNRTIFMLVIAMIGAGFIQKITPGRIRQAWKNSAVEAVFCVIVLVLSIASIASNSYNPFIYFQF